MEAEKYFLEIVLENTEAVLDTLTDNEILKNIPVVGSAVKLIKAANDIRDRLFAAKLHKFLFSLGSQSTETKEKIREKVSTNPDEARKVGETVLLIIDKISEVDKAGLLASLFLAYIYGHLDSDNFRRICNAIDQAFWDDLDIFLKSSHNIGRKGPSKEIYMEYLARTGLTKVVAGKTIDELGEIYYEVTQLGNRFINAWIQGEKLAMNK